MVERKQFLNKYFNLGKWMNPVERKKGHNKKVRKFLNDLYNLYTRDGVSIVRLSGCYQVSIEFLEKEFKKIKKKRSEKKGSN